ncbi:MAG: hypothetical protein WCA79_02795 [Anaerolineales bacterium]
MCNYSMTYADSLDDGKHPARLSKEEKIRLQRRTAKHEKLAVDRRQEADEKKEATRTQ